MNANTFRARAALASCLCSIWAGLAFAPVATAAEDASAEIGQPQVRAKPAKTTRTGPKRREGKEGSEDAKLEAEEARELYIRRKRRLEQIQAQQQELSKDKRLLATNRARMQARLIDTARSLRLSERRLTEIEERLAKTRLKVKEQREKLDDKSAQMSALFALMQGMSRQPPPVMITHSRDALNMIRSGMVLATFYEDVEKLATQISSEVDELEKAQKQAEKQEHIRKTEQSQASRLKSQIDLLLIENREQLETTLTNLEGLKSASKIHVASLKNLEEVLPTLDAEVGKRSELGAYENELKQNSAELKPDASKTALLQPGRMKPSIPFAKSQGLLPLPVQGRMLTRFAQNGDDGAPSKGVHLETRAGAQVVSPCDGWILYAGPFRSYGQLLIINPGGGYHIVIAGMDHVQATVGQFVLAGEPVGVMGTVEVRNGEKTPIRPTLYVEFRRDQQPIDPAPWWSAGIGKG